MSENQTAAGKSPLAITGNQPNGFTPHLVTGLKADFFEVTGSGVVIKPGMERDHWLTLAADAIGDFEHSRDSHLVTMLRVGDVLAYGEAAYPEEYGQAIDATRKAIRLSVKTLQNVQWICGSVKPETRRLMLTLAHHEVVAKLTPEEQETFLARAEEEELTAAELRKQVKLAHPNPNKKSPARKVVIDLEDEDGLFHALEKICEFFESPDEQEKPVCDWEKERLAKWAPSITRLFAIFAGSDEVSREAAKEIAGFLDNPDNNPVKDWSDTRKKRWADSLNRIAKAGRRMGVTSCGTAKKADEKAE